MSSIFDFRLCIYTCYGWYFIGRGQRRAEIELPIVLGHLHMQEGDLNSLDLYPMIFNSKYHSLSLNIYLESFQLVYVAKIVTVI